MFVKGMNKGEKCFWNVKKHFLSNKIMVASEYQE